MRITAPACVSGTLEPYVPSAAQPWNKRRVMHLYRRLGFGATPGEVTAALAKSPGALVDELIDRAVNLPLPAPPAWSDWNIDDYSDFQRQLQEQLLEWALRWVNDMYRDGPREKLALFWHNHFVTRFETYACPSQLYRYHRLLQQHAFGNFKAFVYEMGKTPAMLVFLNGVQNTRFQPNENYARELYELFTLGRDQGYTQQDIVETARALSGWNGYSKFCGPIDFVPLLHDSGEKTIFGRRGPWGYDDVHRILFEERGELIARHICGKIYRHFAHPNPNEEIIEGLAATFLANDFAIAPLLRQLFRSAHFFDEHMVATQIKSPLDCFLAFIREGVFPFDQTILEGTAIQAFLLGQQLSQPDDVAGWPGNRAWINSSTMIGRWQALRYFLFYTFFNYPEQLRTLARGLTDPGADAAMVARALVDHFLPNGLDRSEAYDKATAIFKHEIPENYFEQGLWNLNWETVPGQVALLLDHIARLPEFQLG